MAAINPELHLLAHRKAYGHELVKQADPMPGMGGGMPPQGGMPPPGGMPPQGGMPQQGGMPGTSPGQPPPGLTPPPMDPTAMLGGGMPGQGGMMGQPQQPPKMKPEQYMQMLDYRLYNMQQQMTAIMNALQIQLPPEAIVMPPGSAMPPPAEAALPGSGSPVDQATQQQGAAGGGAPGGAIKPIEPMQGATPPGQDAGGMPGKQASDAALFGEFLSHGIRDPLSDDRAPSYIGDPVPRTPEQRLSDVMGIAEAPTPVQNKAAALAAMFRSAAAA